MARSLKFMIGVLCLSLVTSCMETKAQNDKEVIYMPLGDSYTIGTGATDGNSWPEILTHHLKVARIKLSMPEHSVKTEFVTHDLKNYQLNVFL